MKHNPLVCGLDKGGVQICPACRTVEPRHGVCPDYPVRFDSPEWVTLPEYERRTYWDYLNYFEDWPRSRYWRWYLHLVTVELQSEIIGLYLAAKADAALDDREWIESLIGIRNNGATRRQPEISHPARATHSLNG